MSEHTISINGVQYDAHSGLPDDAAKHTGSSRQQSSHAASVHKKTQRSQTLQRNIAKKPAGVKRMDIAAPRRQPGSVQRSPHITKFAPNPQPLPKHIQTSQDVAPATVHPHVAKAHAKAHQKHAAKQPVHIPASEIKEQAIAKALENAKPAKAHKSQKSSSRLRKMNVASASLAVVLLAGYLTYLNLPALSVRVAAAQAGIDASYPDYRPTGYRLDGPVAYSGGEVTMKFKANAGPQTFALNQESSTWDSSALLTNYIEPKAASEYDTYSDAGLTIYTYGSNAAWVNGGILYTLEGDAPLSNEQIRHIATSM